MKKNQKKTYEKPKVTKINLDAKCAVLGFCKSSSGPPGPGGPTCIGIGVGCYAQGS